MQGRKMRSKYENQTIKTLLTRACCRNFDSQKKLSDKNIRIILRAAQASPSAKNRQPWFFIVIKNRNCLKEIAQAAFLGRQKQFANWNKNKARKMIKGNAFNNSNDAVIGQAPLAILVLRSSDPKYKEALEKELNIKEEQGVACSCYSIMVAAWSFGLGSCWLCSALYIKKALKKILKKYGIVWQKTWQPRVILPIGYPIKKLIKPERKSLRQISQLI